MTVCQHCGAKSTLFLCNPHTVELRDMLTDLPRLAAHLAESATGQTRLGERARRGPSEEAPMRVNLRASDLAGQVNATLVRWVQDLCDSHGVTYRAPVIIPPSWASGYEPQPGEILSDYNTDTAKLAFWLAGHAAAIAAGDDAGMCFDEIRAHIGRILAIINRPVPPRFCGPCPAEHPTEHGKQCGMALMASREAADVVCPQCETAHNVEVLLARLLREVDHWRFTRKEVLMIMTILGDKLHERQFQRWRKDGAIKPRGYRRRDGRISLTKHSDDDEPVYRLSDVRSAGRAKATTR